MEKYPGYLGLLKWSLAQSDGLGTPDVKPMSEEDKKFLQEALASVVVDQIAVMKGCVAILSLPNDPADDDKPGGSPVALLGPPAAADATATAAAPAAAAAAAEATPSNNSSEGGSGAGAGAGAGAATAAGDAKAGEEEEKKEAGKWRVAKSVEERVAQKAEALDYIADMIDRIDMANDLAKVGGLQPVLDHLSNEEPTLRAKAASVVAEVVQNNPEGQIKVIQAGALQQLLRLLVDTDKSVRFKGLTAVSAILRECEPAQEMFRQSNGWGVIATRLQAPEPRMQAKAAFFCRHMCLNPGNRRFAVDAGVTPLLVELSKSEDVNIREHAQAALCELTQHEAGLKAAQAAGLKEVVDSRIALIEALTGEDREDAETELELCSTLASRC